MNEILAPKLIGLDVTDQAKIDKMMVEELLGNESGQLPWLMKWRSLLLKTKDRWFEE